MMFINSFDNNLNNNENDVFTTTTGSENSNIGNQLLSKLTTSVISSSNNNYGFLTPSTTYNVLSNDHVTSANADNGIISNNTTITAISAYNNDSNNVPAFASTIQILSQLTNGCHILSSSTDYEFLYGMNPKPKPPLSTTTTTTTTNNLLSKNTTLLDISETNFQQLQDVKPTIGSRAPSSACEGCHEEIVDKCFMQIGEQSWHENCTRCNVCSQSLDESPSCFCRNGLLYCRNDYMQKFTRRCERCAKLINPGELVMHATPTRTFHLSCFTCILCRWSFNTGETYFLGTDGALICQRHYDNLPFCDKNGITLHLKNRSNHSIISEKSVSPLNTYNCEKFILKESGGGKKRDDIDIKNPLLHSESTGHLNDTNRATATISSSLAGDEFLSNDNNSNRNSAENKAKRMRTSFKHPQLRMMKNYFNLNHNPDAKDLKQLAIKTGLSKRVLQVWFQNARAKFRRTQHNQRVDSTLSRCGIGMDDGINISSPYAVELQILSNTTDMNGFRYISTSIPGRTSISPTDSTSIFDGGSSFADDSASSVGANSDNDSATRPSSIIVGGTTNIKSIPDANIAIL